jgi:hypothetical protein
MINPQMVKTNALNEMIDQNEMNLTPMKQSSISAQFQQTGKYQNFRQPNFGTITSNKGMSDDEGENSDLCSV